MRGVSYRGDVARSVLLSVLSLCGTCNAQTSTTASAPEISLTLEEAIHRAELNEPVFATAVAQSKSLALERANARAALLPMVTYHNQVVYTQPNGQANRIGQTANEPTPVFIANNAVREYASQGVLNETLGLGQLAAIRLADANAARGSAELEVARRGLVATVVSLFYSVEVQSEKFAVAERALAEAEHFLAVTKQREAARESAHADVLRAQLQQQARMRELAEVKLAGEKARLELGVLLFPNPATGYELTVTPAASLPDLPAMERAARANNPELKSAAATVQAAEASTASARAALLPDLVMNAVYGIDAPQFAKHGPEDTRNLGYSASATIDIPVWDWLTSERRIKQSRIAQDAARTGFDAAQRTLLANLAEVYSEAATAQAALTSLAASEADAKESLRLTNLRYTDGEATVLEVVDAQNTVLSAENQRLDGSIRCSLALAQLQTLTGIL